ncbi:3-deoxy-7-phosphoheptulonate synthase [Limnoglobus roseus]|uniref:Phospho-2-dehydro-3-deoxyheptonate aldolase n=1 Tax=Limnoglobus roseus TaxID=2598579 RepID=A0A5C1AFG3_9BACT|nr:3-deoxy-7-phosphoheptulonate synthase [Limnoglobus roseus]QEL16472.1 3-deoxy-7-phosphoheptulonate synthase [Limnoglobus roseus]
MTTDPTPPFHSDRTSRTDDERIASVVPLPPPESLIRFFPISGSPAEELVARTRSTVREILDGRDDRLLVIVGPCSIHDPAAALEYASRLVEVRQRLAADLEVVMRVYFEKPRTTVGWKGLINDPALDGTFRINEGLRIARDLLIRVNGLRVPAGCEFLDTISPQYIGDLVSWGAIGARTTESQVHRELASGLSAPIGFKNATDGDVQVAVDAILAAGRPHHFLSVHKNGQVAIVETRGNDACHVILRGGSAPNYDAPSVAAACRALAAAGLPERLMVDVSHANSSKRYDRQPAVAAAVAAQVAGGDRRIVGMMAESNLVEGRQDLTVGRALTYGQSVTDGCIGWAETVQVLEELAGAVRSRRTRSTPPGK